MPVNPLGTPLTVTPDVEQAPWVDIPARIVGHGRIARVGLLRNGTSEGRASFALVVELDDGGPGLVVAETTWRLMHAAIRALAASPVAAEETLD